MADKTKIEWTDATWNPITGCSVVSPGCTNCYAMKLAGTRLKNHESRKGLTRETKAGPVWTGEVRFNERWLDQPLRWSKPRMIFVCAHADLFAEGVKDEWIDQIFAVMALSPQHTFQVLTKRPERMRNYMAKRFGEEAGYTDLQFAAQFRVWTAMPKVERTALGKSYPAWPLPNVWLGVSVEDQKRAEERIPWLLDTPAAVRWISAEPLLGQLDINPYLFIYTHEDEAQLALDLREQTEPLPFRDPATTPIHDICTPRLDWVVAGGESGSGARPMHPDWARALRDQCKDAEVAFHFKQWGAWVPQLGSVDLPDNPEQSRYQWVEWNGEKWEHWNQPQWCDDLDPDESMILVGKKTAGRLLDGVMHDDFPQVLA